MAKPLTETKVLEGINRGMRTARELRLWLHEEGYEASLIRFASVVKKLRERRRIYFNTRKKGWYQ